jgi:ABC-2 type transport system permease protein
MLDRDKSYRRISRGRLIWAIVVKDFVGSLRNKTLLTNAITFVLLIAFYRFVPGLVIGNEGPTLALYDAGKSTMVRELDRSSVLRLRQFSSYEDLLYRLGGEELPEMGLVLPADFDQRATRGEVIPLEGVVNHWVSEDELASMLEVFEGELSRIAGTSIEIKTSREFLTRADSFLGLKMAFSVLILMGMVGMMYIPQMILAEREDRTLDVMQVSPASLTDMLIAKGLVGLAYSFLFSLVMVVAYYPFVLHWWSLAGAVLSGAIFLASLGLFLGVFLKQSSQLRLWSLVIFQPLIVTLLLYGFEAIPQNVRMIMRWLPTGALGQATTQAIIVEVDPGAYLVSMLILVAWGLGILWAVSVRLRREYQ